MTLARSVLIGTGTDSGGGFSISILDAMRQAFIVSNARQLMHGDQTLSIDECFYMATLVSQTVDCISTDLARAVQQFVVWLTRLEALLLASTSTHVLSVHKMKTTVQSE